MTKTRGVIIAGNWKMNSGLKETETFFDAVRAKNFSSAELASFKTGRIQAIVFPPATSLDAAMRASASLPYSLRVGAQNAHWEKKGAYTGELSGPLLSEMKITDVLVGHSERRQYFGETDESVRKRTESLCEQGFRVILCIGETKQEREAGRTDEILNRQLSGVFADAKSTGKPASAFLDGRLVIAYEPVWAIGTGLTATPEQAEEAHQTVRKWLWDHLGLEASGRTPILYGGSVTPENIESLLKCPNVDGALVGGASLKPESYLALLSAGLLAVS